MKKDSAIIIFYDRKRETYTDVEVPLDITANELVTAMNSAFDLGIDLSNIKACYLKAENPILLLRGNKTLKQYGIRNGSIITY